MRLALLTLLGSCCLLPLEACGSPRLPRKIDWVPAQAGPVAPFVMAQEQRARHEGKRVLVYVGATWCEPCRKLHEAVQRGALDAQFGELRLLEFDLDRDSERLAEAGYVGRFIPLLAVPDEEGRASGKQFAGSVKGDGAVDRIVADLTKLLGQTR
ncbi:MAG: thioredoxin [Polyangia bacterium]